MSDEDTQVIFPAPVNGQAEEPEEPQEAETPSTLLESLRAKRAELAAEQTHEVLVPGYAGRVAIRCGPISGRQQAALLDRLAKSKSPERDVNLNADYLIAACREVVVRDGYDQPWQSLADVNGGEPVGVEPHLADLLALQPTAPTARGVLFSLFALAPSPEVAITIAGGEYIGWAGGINEELDEAYLGE